MASSICLYVLLLYAEFSLTQIPLLTHGVHQTQFWGERSVFLPVGDIHVEERNCLCKCLPGDVEAKVTIGSRLGSRGSSALEAGSPAISSRGKSL